MDSRSKALVGAWGFGILCVASLWLSLAGPLDYQYWGWMVFVATGILTFVCVGAAREAPPEGPPMLPFGPGTADRPPEAPPPGPPPEPDPLRERDVAICAACGHSNEGFWTICADCGAPRSRER